MVFINIADYFLFAWFVFMFYFLVRLVVFSLKEKVNPLGSPSVNVFVFYFGKFLMFFSWVLLFFVFIGVLFERVVFNLFVDVFISFLILFSGFVLFSGLFYLDKNLRAGIPSEKTSLVTSGIYKFSRNPMHFGAFLFGFVILFYVPMVFVFFVVFFSVYCHHLMVLAEERFLRARFGKKYVVYCKRTPRYF